MKDFCIILTRHIKHEDHNNLWIECIKSIRKYYINDPIIIIDDNSNQDLIHTIPDMSNITIINSEFCGAGELLPYYYFYKYNFSKKALIIHDSMFIKARFNYELIDNIRFLWYFPKNIFFEDELNIKIGQKNVLLSFLFLNYSLELYNLYTSNNWLGCFGVSSIISHDFIKLLENKYNIFNLIHIINSKFYRELLERIFAVIVYYELNINNNFDLSIFGNIHDYPYCFIYNFKNYQDYPLNYPIIKCWNGR